MTGDRSVSDVLQDILRNVQEILRSEVRLAKAEIRQEATQSGLVGTVGDGRGRGRAERVDVPAVDGRLRPRRHHADVGRHTRDRRRDGRCRERVDR